VEVHVLAHPVRYFVEAAVGARSSVNFRDESGTISVVFGHSTFGQRWQSLSRNSKDST
jgi:hypothetical protein